MMIALLIAGIGAVLAGILTILYGIQLELSLGNSLIVAGTIALCGGLVVLGLCLVVTELRIIARRLGAGAGAEARRPILPQGAGERGLLGREPVAIGEAAPGPAEPAAPVPPWQEEMPGRERARPEVPAQQPVEAPVAAAPPAPKRRNLLFASSSRKERERAQTRGTEPAAPEEHAAPPVTPPPPAEPAPAAFEDAWPKPERRELAPQRRPARTPSTFAEPAPAPERPAEPPRAEAPPAVTVLKSGVVDGMAYSLYSDGSIEAQMPEGMMRFASIDELRAHLDQRG